MRLDDRAKAVFRLSAMTLAVCGVCVEANAQQAVRSANEGVEEVVVTATRRSERLQDVPLAISAVSGEQLKNSGISNLDDMQFITPGLQKGASSDDGGFRIRGIGTMVSESFFTSSEKPVGVVIDGVIQGLGSSLGNLGDVQRVEVLKGPQGTQFGKNSAAGVINVTTIRPSTDGFSGKVYGSYGTRNEKDVHGRINLPLGTHTALSISAYDKSYDGYVKNLPSGKMIGGSDETGVRAKLFSQLSDNLDMLLMAESTRQTIDAGSSSLWTVNSYQPGAVAQTNISPGFGNYANNEPFIGSQTKETTGYSAEFNYKLGEYTLTSVSAYQTLKSHDLRGAGGGFGTFAIPAFGDLGLSFWGDDTFDKSQTTQEFRITSPKNQNFQYVAGYLYYKQPTDYRVVGGFLYGPGSATPGWFNAGAFFARLPGNPMGLPPFLIPILSGAPLNSGEPDQGGVSNVYTETISNAVYADGKYTLSEATSLLFGLRKTRDSMNARFQNLAYDGGPLGAAFAVPGGKYASTSSSTSESKLTYKLGIEHKLDKDVLLFASYSTGYLGPILNYHFQGGNPDMLKPQTNSNITLGIKSQFFNRRLTVNANLFQDKYKDFQTGFIVTAPAVYFQGENAGNLSTRGVELDGSFRISSDWTVGGGLAYVDAKFGDYCSGGAVGYVGTQGITACTTSSGAAGGQIGGFVLNSAPKLSANAYVNYNTPVGNGYLFSSTVSYYYRDSSRLLSYMAETETPAYGLLNLSASLGKEDDSWRVGVAVRNLFDKHFATPVMQVPVQPTYVNWTNPQALRYVGVFVEADF